MFSGTCEVEIGRNIGADYIISGNILEIENVYLLTLKFYDTHSGNLLSGTEVNSTSLITLLQDAQLGTANILQQSLDITPKIDPYIQDPPKEPISISKNSSQEECPISTPITDIEVKSNYIRINNQMWYIYNPQLQYQFENVLSICQQHIALEYFYALERTIPQHGFMVGLYGCNNICSSISAVRSFNARQN